MTMLTANAEDHARMRNFHKPDDEKRMGVVLPGGSTPTGWTRQQIAAWTSCGNSAGSAVGYRRAQNSKVRRESTDDTVARMH